MLRATFLGILHRPIRNPNTRRAYLIAAWRFADWCGRHGIPLAKVEPMVVEASRISKHLTTHADVFRCAMTESGGGSRRESHMTVSESSANTRRWFSSFPTRQMFPNRVQR